MSKPSSELVESLGAAIRALAAAENALAEAYNEGSTNAGKSEIVTSCNEVMKIKDMITAVVARYAEEDAQYQKYLAKEITDAPLAYDRYLAWEKFYQTEN